MARFLPTLETPSPFHTADTHGQIREWLEYLTSNSDQTQLDWTSYSTIAGWCARADYLPIVEEVVKRRLEYPGPGCDKAIILAQSLPVTSLIPLIDLLKSLSTSPENQPATLYTTIAAHLLHAANTLKFETDAKAAEDDVKFKWEAWGGLYGKPAEGWDWRPLPKEVEWGMWGLVPVSPTQWWEKHEGEGK